MSAIPFQSGRFDVVTSFDVMQYVDDDVAVVRGVDVLAHEADPQTQIEFWWLVLLLVIGLLAFEVWMTRRIAGAVASPAKAASDT